MLNFEIEKMKKQVKNIYLYLQNNTNSWNIKVCKTKWRNKISKNSYCFDIPNIESGNDKIKIISEYLKNIFKISVNEINDLEKIDSFIIMENDKPKILKDENGTDVFILDTNKTIRKRTKGYVGGIKQIISHYIGLNNFIKTKIIKGNKINPKAKILFGEIVFDFPEQTDMYDYLIDYEKKYTSLATILNNNSEIMVLPSLLHFSNYKERLNDTIKQFYYGI